MASLSNIIAQEELLFMESDSQEYLQLKPNNDEQVKKLRTSQDDLDFQAPKLANQQLLNGYATMSHPTSADYVTTPLSTTSVIWATGPVFKMEIEHVFTSNNILFQKIQLTYQKNIIQDKTYMLFENKYVKWIRIPSTKNLPGNAICDVAANEIVVAYQCLDLDHSAVKI